MFGQNQTRKNEDLFWAQELERPKNPGQQRYREPVGVNASGLTPLHPAWVCILLPARKEGPLEVTLRRKTRSVPDKAALTGAPEVCYWGQTEGSIENSFYQHIFIKSIQNEVMLQ